MTFLAVIHASELTDRLVTVDAYVHITEALGIWPMFHYCACLVTEFYVNSHTLFIGSQYFLSATTAVSKSHLTLFQGLSTRSTINALIIYYHHTTARRIGWWLEYKHERR